MPACALAWRPPQPSIRSHVMWLQQFRSKMLGARDDNTECNAALLSKTVRTSWSVTEMCARRANSRTSGGATPLPPPPLLLRHCRRAAGCANAANRTCCAERDAGKQRRAAERASTALILPAEGWVLPPERLIRSGELNWAVEVARHRPIAPHAEQVARMPAAAICCPGRA